MNKMAVFVEGCTEQLFVEKLVIEIAGRKNVQVELRKVRGGKTTRRRMPRVKPMGARMLAKNTTYSLWTAAATKR